MELKVTKADGKPSRKHIDLNNDVFDYAFNESLVHQAVTAYMAKGRAGTRAQKTRSEVRGGGAKPWRQKGTGHARAGTIRSPLWRGGGRTFAAKTRDYSQKLNKKMYSRAMRSIVSELVRQDRIIVLDDFVIDEPKTKLLAQKLKDLGVDSVLIVTDSMNDNLFLSARNLHKVGLCEASYIDPMNLVRFEKILFTVPAIKKIEEMLV